MPYAKIIVIKVNKILNRLEYQSKYNNEKFKQRGG